jgi:hypothetical protein
MTSSSKSSQNSLGLLSFSSQTTCLHGDSPLALVSLSLVAVTHSQPPPENIKWEIPEIVIHLAPTALF